jgi:hypothetical protein
MSPEATSTEWGYKIRGGKKVRIVPGAFSAADVHQALQEGGQLYAWKPWQIVSREVTEWTFREAIPRTKEPK